MEALTNALALLVALEARMHDLVDPVTQIADAVKAVVKEAAIVVEDLGGRVSKIEDLEARVKALEAHATAVSLAPAVQSDIPAFPPIKADAPVVESALSIGELQARIDTAIDATQTSAVDELHQNVSGAPAEGSGT